MKKVKQKFWALINNGRIATGLLGERAIYKTKKRAENECLEWERIARVEVREV